MTNEGALPGAAFCENFIYVCYIFTGMKYAKTDEERR